MTKHKEDFVNVLSGLMDLSGELVCAAHTVPTAAKCVHELPVQTVTGSYPLETWNNENPNVPPSAADRALVNAIGFLYYVTIPARSSTDTHLGKRELLLSDPESPESLRFNRSALLYRSELTVDQVPNLEPTKSSMADMLKRIIFISVSYRIGTANQLQKPTLTTKFGALLRANGIAWFLNDTFCSSLAASHGLTKVMAYLDFVMSQSTDDNHRLVRIGTITTFMKDAAAGSRILTCLTNPAYLRMIVYFCIHRQAYRELKSVMDNLSHLPRESCHQYMSALGLVDKNGMSASENGAAFIYVSTMMAIQSVRPLYNTVIQVGVPNHHLVCLAFLVTRYINQSDSFGLFVRSQNETTVIEDVNKTADHVRWPRAREMLLYRIKLSSDLTPEETITLKSGWTGDSSRPSTIGEIIQNWAFTTSEKYIKEWVSIMKTASDDEFELRARQFLSSHQEEIHANPEDQLSMTFEVASNSDEEA